MTETQYSGPEGASSKVCSAMPSPLSLCSRSACSQVAVRISALRKSDWVAALPALLGQAPERCSGLVALVGAWAAATRALNIVAWPPSSGSCVKPPRVAQQKAGIPPRYGVSGVRISSMRKGPRENLSRSSRATLRQMSTMHASYNSALPTCEID